jgi:hypothetical protein
MMACQSNRLGTHNRENFFVVIDHWSMSFGIEMLAESALFKSITLH